MLRAPGLKEWRGSFSLFLYVRFVSGQTVLQKHTVCEMPWGKAGEGGAVLHAPHCPGCRDAPEILQPPPNPQTTGRAF